MNSDLLIPLVTGFLASFHCIGMCGPIVAGFVAQKPIAIDLPGATSLRLGQVLSPHLYYNLGRVISYSLVGLFAGAVGSLGLLDPSLQRWMSVGLGVLMILTALFQVGTIKLRKGKGGGRLLKVFNAFGTSHTMESRFLVGMLTPLLPCGLIYAVAAQAASSLSPISGALTMGSFAVGAIPALVFTGSAVSFVSAKVRKMGTYFAAALIIFMGLLTIARGFGMSTSLLGHPMSLIEHLCGVN